MKHAFLCTTSLFLSLFLSNNVVCQAFVLSSSSSPTRQQRRHTNNNNNNNNNAILVLMAQKKMTKSNNKSSPPKARDLLDASAQTDDSGYDVGGTLLRQGPIPAFIRITQPQKYQAAVDKFMRQEQCSRSEAMANMDYYFNDPLGWAAKRKRYEAGNGAKPNFYDNSQPSPTSLVLTTVWGVISTWFIWRIIQYRFLGVDYHDNFWGF